MKLNKYFLIGAMGLGLFACSDDNALDNNTQGNEPQIGEGYAAISLDFSNMSARDVTDPTDGSTHVGTAEEQAVKSLYVILAASDGTYTDADVKGGTTTSLATDYANETYVFSTNAGVKNVYVVVNPDVAPNDASLTTKSIASYFDTLSDITGHSANGFMMSSTEKVQVTVLSGTTRTEAIASAAEVKVERVEAKITATYTKGETIAFTGGTGEDGTGGTIGDLTYDLYRANTKGYRMSQGTTTAIAFNPAADENAHQTSTVEPGKQPAELTNNLIYCLENISTTNYPDAEVAYIDFNTTYIPGEVINAEGKLETNTDVPEDKTFYYITSAPKGELDPMYNQYMYKEVYEDNAEKLGISGVEYPNGVCHFGSIKAGNQDTGKVGEILRNHWYNYEITSLTLPGHPSVVPPGALTYMAVRLTVLPWNFRTFEIPLE